MVAENRSLTLTADEIFGACLLLLVFWFMVILYTIFLVSINVWFYLIMGQTYSKTYIGIGN